MEKYKVEKLCEPPFHQILKQTTLSDSLRDSGAVSLLRSATWDKKSTYFVIETHLALTRDVNDELVDKFSHQVYTQGSIGMKKNFIVQQLLL